MHHKLYVNNINMPMNFIETTFSNNNNPPCGVGGGTSFCKFC